MLLGGHVEQPRQGSGGGEDPHAVNCPAKLVAYSTDLRVQRLGMNEFEHVYGELFSDKYEELLHSGPLLLELRKLNILNVQGHARTEANSIFTQPLTDQLAAKLAPALMCSAVWNLSRARKMDYAKADGASASVQADVEARFVKQVSLSIAAVKNVIFASQWGGKGMPKEVLRGRLCRQCCITGVALSTSPSSRNARGLLPALEGAARRVCPDGSVTARGGALSRVRVDARRSRRQRTGTLGAHSDDHRTPGGPTGSAQAHWEHTVPPPPKRQGGGVTAGRRIWSRRMSGPACQSARARAARPCSNSYSSTRHS
jgi:hypothetical protein